MQSGESIDGENKNFPNLQKVRLCDDSPFDFVVFGSTIKSMLRPQTGSGTQDLCHTVYIFLTQCQLFIPSIQTTANNKTTDREQCEKSLDREEKAMTTTQKHSLPDKRPSCTVCSLGDGNLAVKSVAVALMFSFFFIEKAKVHYLGKTATAPSKLEFSANRVLVLGEGRPEWHAKEMSYSFILRLRLEPSPCVTMSLGFKILGGSAMEWRQILGLPLPHVSRVTLSM